MSTVAVKDKKSLLRELEKLQSGDCVEISSFSSVAGSGKEMLSLLKKIDACEAELVSLQEGVDTRGEQKAGYQALLRALSAFDRSKTREKQRSGIERAKQEGKYKGRKPIEVDNDLFEEVIASWQAGLITARQAMAQLGLKPNTFYRRIKERDEQKLEAYRKAEQEIRSEMKEAARKSKKERDAMKKQVKAEERELKKQKENNGGN